MKALIVTTMTACLALAACNKSAEQGADQLESSMDNAAEMASARLDHTADVAENRIDSAMDRMGAAITPASTPQEFIDAAAKSDAFEIQAARLAEKNASSAEVKIFAQEMIKAHTDSTAKIKKAASAAELTPNATLTEDQREDLTKLGKLTGAAFDDEYMDEQVDAHESALALMKSFGADGKGAGLKAAADEITPVVASHLTMARELEKKTDR